MFKGKVLFYVFRGNKPVTSALFTFPTNPTEQFNNFKKYIIIKNLVLLNGYFK